MVNYNYLLKYLFVYQTHTHDSCLPSQNNLLRMLPIFFASLTKRLTEQVKESSLYSTSHGGVQSILAASTGTTFYKSTSCNKQTDNVSIQPAFSILFRPGSHST